MARKTKVRTTFTPGEVIAVDERELLDLQRQGVIHSTENDDNWKSAEADEPEPPETEAPSATKKGGRS